MLCPEVINFPSPKVVVSSKRNESLDSVLNTINLNNFYKSIIVTLPDELNPPSFFEELLEDTDFYKICDCSLTEFTEAIFIDKFIKNGSLYCLTANKYCIINSCAAITPDGILTLHLPDYIFQTIGLEGTKCPHNFFEINVNLKTANNLSKIRLCLSKLEKFDFYISWEPNEQAVCPSSVAKYFHERNIIVTLQSTKTRHLTPEISEIPVLCDTELDEMTEWLGMLAVEGDLTPTATYISTYGQPESENAIKSTRIAVAIASGLFTPLVISKLCKYLQEFIHLRELEHYWVAISVQSYENSLWQWSPSSIKMFQAHDSSCNIFFTKNGLHLYSIGQLKYS